jgi:voltage-gated potassium channel
MALTRDQQEARWEKATATPLLILALVFLFDYAMPIINPNLEPEFLLFLEISNAVIWLVFAVDLAGRFILAEHKKPFIKRNIIMIISVVFPFLRLLRLISVLTMGLSRYGGSTRNKFGFYVLGGSLLLWFITGLAVTQAERGMEGSNISDVGDGWWWSLITLATVGYGDRFPVTPEGRFIGAVIVITGIALLGTISAFLASFLMDPSGKRDAEILKDSEKANATIYDLLSEVKALRAEVQALSGVSLAKKPEPSQGVTVKKATSAKKPVSKK